MPVTTTNVNPQLNDIFLVLLFFTIVIEQSAWNKTLQMYVCVYIYYDYYTTTVQIVARITEMVGVLKTIAFGSVVN